MVINDVPALKLASLGCPISPPNQGFGSGFGPKSDNILYFKYSEPFYIVIYYIKWVTYLT